MLEVVNVEGAGGRSWDGKSDAWKGARARLQRQPFMKTAMTTSTQDMLLKCSVSVLLILLRLFPYLLLFAFCTRDPLCIRLLRNFLLRSFFHLRSTCLSIYSVLYLVLMLSQSLV